MSGEVELNCTNSSQGVWHAAKGLASSTIHTHLPDSFLRSVTYRRAPRSRNMPNVLIEAHSLVIKTQ
jgi:hypothetical protein